MKPDNLLDQDLRVTITKILPHSSVKNNILALVIRIKKNW